ncbi:MAG: L-rhamnose catabolism isomerase [Rhizobiales bacterium]|nr:L-rhamnose catabolism isomerase [Hyphomicrobiales bacterium]NRB15612.1 L-rhamnose catabolism isomerase [Hyphomicrobiales bacterium]
MTDFGLDINYIAEQNKLAVQNVKNDYDNLGEKLARQNIDIEAVKAQIQKFAVAIPSWGVGTGGTRFARFPGIGEPRNIFEKLDDCCLIQQLTQATPSVSLHIPWDKVDDPSELKQYGNVRGLAFDAMNSNTFQDQEGQKHSYKFGSLSHVDKATREQAVAHNIDCIEFGEKLGSKALTVWIGDGSNFPGQVNFAKSFDRYIESMRKIYAALPDDWKLFTEHKIYEPAFYSTLMQDWGTNLMTALELGDKAHCLVDLGHHAPTVNIEMIVSRLVQAGKLGGFHFNDSKYGDDDLDSGSINPYQLFLVFNELVEAENNIANFNPMNMIDQSHNVTDPIESLMTSAMEIQRAYAQALLVNRTNLEAAQNTNDALRASETLKQAYRTDVEPILAMARLDLGGAIDPVSTYRVSGYRTQKAKERPSTGGSSSGII